MMSYFSKGSLLLVFVFITTFYISPTISSAQSAPTACSIVSFTSDRSMVQSGGATSLRFSLNGKYPWDIEVISGDGIASPSQGSSSFSIVSSGSISQTTTYKLSCGNDFDNPDDFAFVTVSAPTRPVCTGPTSARSGETVSFSAYGGDNNVYIWSSPTSNPSSVRGQIFNTTFTNSGPSPVTQTVTVSSGGLSTTCPITINPLSISNPTCTLTASPARGNVPFNSVITWSAENASSCIATGAWAGPYPIRSVSGGTKDLYNSTPGTFANGMTCTNATNTASGECSVTVTSEQIATISIGGSRNFCQNTLGNYTLQVVSTRDSFIIRHVTASGQSGNVTAIEPPTTAMGRSFGDVGAVGDNARFELVNANTNQIMAVYNVGVSGCNTVTGNPVPAPNVQFSASSSNVSYGGSITVSWTTTGAVYCDINGQPVPGSQLASGSQTYNNITTYGTQRYVMTCNSGTNGGVTVRAVDVPVIQPFVPPPPLPQGTPGGTGQITYNTSGNCSMNVSLNPINTSPYSTRPPYQFAGTINATIPGAGGTTGNPFGASAICQISASGTNLIRGTTFWGYGGGTLGVDADFSQPTGTVTYRVHNCMIVGGTANAQNCSATANVSYPAIPAPPSFIFTKDPNDGRVPFGGTARLYWYTSNIASCTASGDWSGNKAVAAENSQIVTNITSFPRFYYLDCVGNNGVSLPRQTVVINELEALPTIQLTASPSSITVGQQSTISWQTTNAQDCTFTNGTASWRSAAFGPANGSVVVDDVTSGPTVTFTMNCVNRVNRSVSRDITINVSPSNAAPDIVFFANPAAVDSGNGATLHWRVQNAASCSSGGDGPWGTPTQSVVTNSTCATPTAAGCQNYPLSSITSDKSFALTCTSAGGQTVTRYATVLVNDPPPPVVQIPIVTLTATPNQGPSPLTTTISWNVANGATSCIASGGQGGWAGAKSQLVSGSQLISGITSQTTFTMTCSNSAGSNTSSVTTTIANPTNGNLNVIKARGGTVTSNPPHNGHINCGGSSNACSRSYVEGTTVTLTATRESSQWEFVGWQGACRGNGVCNVYIRGNATETVTPIFMVKPIIYKEF